MPSEICVGQLRRDLKGMNSIRVLTTAVVLSLPEALRLFLRWIILRRAVTNEEVAGFLATSEAEALSLINELDELGMIERLPTCGVPRYWVRLSPRRLRPPPELLNLTEG